MGEYLEQVVLPEFGVDIYIRVKPENFDKIAKFQDIGFFSSIRNSWKGRDQGRYASVGFW